MPAVALACYTEQTMRALIVPALMLYACALPLVAQQQPGAKPEDTEVWQPVPPVVTPGPFFEEAPPSDAIVLFNGSDLNEWVNAQDHGPAPWNVHDGVMTVSKAPGSGNIETKRKFHNYQMHVEWRIPPTITGEGQARGNSGVFLASLGPGDAGFELQVLDSYGNKTGVVVEAGYWVGEPVAQAWRVAKL